ncbi:MAG: hypothetical protein QM757_47215 [Paludibaculum sp.]
MRIGSESVLALNPPFIIDGNVTQSNGSTTPVFILKNGFPASSFAGATADLTRTQIRAQDTNQRSSYVSQVSFGPQIQLTEDTNLDISYVGNFGRKMNRLRNANQGLVTGFTNGAPVTLFPYVTEYQREHAQRESRVSGVCNERRQYELQRVAGVVAKTVLERGCRTA